LNAVQKSVGSERTESKVGFSEASISTVIAAFDFLARPWKWIPKYDINTYPVQCEMTGWLHEW